MKGMRLLPTVLIVIGFLLILVWSAYVALYLYVKSLPYYWESYPYYWKDSDFIGKNVNEVKNLFPANWGDASGKDFMQCRAISPESYEVYVTLIYKTNDDKEKIISSAINGIIFKKFDTNFFYKKRYTDENNQKETVMLRLPWKEMLFKRKIESKN
jgi:hypothetical protein